MRWARGFFFFPLLVFALMATSAIPMQLDLSGWQDIDVSLDREPALPVEGDSIQLRFLFPRAPSASLRGYRLGQALSFEASSQRPVVSEAGERGSEIIIVLRAEGGGGLVVERVDFEVGVSILEIGPLVIDVSGLGSARSPATWSWEAPRRLWRYESFPLKLRSPGPVPPGAWPSFSLPEGLLLEADKDDFSWIATVLRSGSIQLPRVEIRSSAPARALEMTIPVDELPESLSSTRAIGEYSLSLEGEDKAIERLPYSARLIVSGEGNLPSLLIPPPRLILDGKTLPRASWKERRLDSLSRSARGYSGSVTLEVTLAPPRAGDLRIEFPALPFLSPDGSIKEAAVASLAVRVNAAPLGEVDSGRRGGARAVLASKVAELIKRGEGAKVAEGLQLLDEGKIGPGLARLFHLARVEDRGLRRLTEGLAAEFSAEPPDFGSLPPALPLLLLAAVSLLGTLGLLFAGFWPGKAQRRLRACALALAIFAILVGGLGVLGALDQARPRFLTWSTRLFTIPSPNSELTTEIILGRSGRPLGSVEGWQGLLFRDGSSGWLPANSVYSY